MGARTYIASEFRAQFSKLIWAVLAAVWLLLMKYGVGPLGQIVGLAWWPAAVLVNLLLALVALVAYQQVNRPGAEPISADWHRLEERFRLIGDEVTAVSQVTEETVTWSVYPETREGRQRPYGQGARTVERFRAEATRGGEMIQRVTRLKSNYKVSEGAPAEDHWLSALAANVDRGTGLTGSGSDPMGRHKNVFIERSVDASMTMCTLLASRARE